MPTKSELCGEGAGAVAGVVFWPPHPARSASSTTTISALATSVKVKVEPMRAALVSVLVALVAASPAGAVGPKTCKSPKPVFKDGHVRIWTAVGKLDNQLWWICSG